MEKRQTIVHELNHLIKVCKDSEKGFHLAAKEIQNKEHRALLLATENQRKEFVSDLQRQVRKLGAKPKEHGSPLATLHRAWMNFRYQMNLHDDEVVLIECQRGEESALKAYENAMEANISGDLNHILENQFVTIIDMRDWLSDISQGTGNRYNSETMLHL